MGPGGSVVTASYHFAQPDAVETEPYAGYTIDALGTEGELSASGYPMGFVVRAAVLQLIVRHCQAAVPREACGLIAALDGDGLTRWIPITNAHARPEHNYAFAPEEYLAAVQECELSGERILAVVHSHPDGPPQPSPQDIAYAMREDLHWVIVDMRGFPAFRSYIIRDGQCTREGMSVIM